MGLIMEMAATYLSFIDYNLILFYLSTFMGRVEDGTVAAHPCKPMQEGRRSEAAVVRGSGHALFRGYIRLLIPAVL